MERAMGFEPTTPTLARLCSTPELRPHSVPSMLGTGRIRRFDGADKCWWVGFIGLGKKFGVRKLCWDQAELRRSVGEIGIKHGVGLMVMLWWWKRRFYRNILFLQ